MVEVIADGITLIRRRPGLFFDGGKPSSESLLEAVLRDSGPAPERFQAGVWTLVTSQIDWMQDQLVVPAELFERIIPKPAVGPNQHRSEVLLAASCEGVASFGPSGDVWLGIQESDIPRELLSHAIPGGRTLIWRFTDAGTTPATAR